MNRTVLVLADDLFWKTKIDHALKSAQSPGVFISDPAGLVKASPSRDSRPSSSSTSPSGTSPFPPSRP